MQASRRFLKAGLVRYHFSYYNEMLGEVSKRLNLNRIAHKYSRTICIYGHFNRQRDFGIKDYYLSVGLFVTIMREISFE